MKSTLILSAFFLALAFNVASCSKKIGFQASTVAPAARGDVKVKKDNNGNYSISLSVQMLAEPSRLSPPKSVYMVWMDTERNGTQALGQLKTGSGLFSSTLKASLETSSPYNPRRVYITAEDGATIPGPSGYVVLSTNSF